MMVIWREGWFSKERLEAPVDVFFELTQVSSETVDILSLAIAFFLVGEDEDVEKIKVFSPALIP